MSKVEKSTFTANYERGFIWISPGNTEELAINELGKIYILTKLPNLEFLPALCLDFKVDVCFWILRNWPNTNMIFYIL